MDGVGRLGEKIVLERSITAKGRCRETGNVVRSWNGLSRPMGCVGVWDRSMVLEQSVMANGRCREIGREAWSWNGLSRPRDDEGRLGKKHGLGTVYHAVCPVAVLGSALLFDLRID